MAGPLRQDVAHREIQEKLTRDSLLVADDRYKLNTPHMRSTACPTHRGAELSGMDGTRRRKMSKKPQRKTEHAGQEASSSDTGNDLNDKRPWLVRTLCET